MNELEKNDVKATVENDINRDCYRSAQRISETTFTLYNQLKWESPKHKED